MYNDPDGALPQSNSMWQSGKVQPKHLRAVVKARLGLTCNKKLAKRQRRPYWFRHSTRPTTDSKCPLCGGEDSVSHMTGGCTHPTIRGIILDRHNSTVARICKALQSRRAGGCFTVRDAGKAEDVAKAGAACKRLHGLGWLLPTAPFCPNVLRVHNLLPHPTLAECHRAAAQKQVHPSDVIEVGYCADTRWKDTYDERKRNQHNGLICALEAAGWPVRRYTIMLGSLGAIYKSLLRHLQELGLHPKDALAPIADLSIAAVTDAWKLRAMRRRLEHTRRVRGTPHNPG